MSQFRVRVNYDEGKNSEYTHMEDMIQDFNNLIERSNDDVWKAVFMCKKSSYDMYFICGHDYSYDRILNNEIIVDTTYDNIDEANEDLQKLQLAVKAFSGVKVDYKMYANGGKPFFYLRAFHGDKEFDPTFEYKKLNKKIDRIKKDDALMNRILVATGIGAVLSIFYVGYKISN